MIESKYNYEKAVEHLIEVANTTKRISRHDLMLVLYGKIAENNTESTNFSAALNNLKTRRLRAANIEIMPITKPSDPGGIVYSVKYIEKKDNKNTVAENTTMQALQKDNQKMFIENENLTKEVDTLRRELEFMKAKESEYKNIISSFYSLAMVH